MAVSVLVSTGRSSGACELQSKDVAMAPITRSSATLSIRLLWPFARVLSADPRTQQLPRFPGIELKDFGNPDTRIPNDVVMHALAESVRISEDPLLGFKAGEQLDQADFDLLEYAARA